MSEHGGKRRSSSIVYSLGGLEKAGDCCKWEKREGEKRAICQVSVVGMPPSCQTSARSTEVVPRLATTTPVPFFPPTSSPLFPPRIASFLLSVVW